MAQETVQSTDPFTLSSPRIFLVRMLVFLALVGILAFVLWKQILVAFMANPGLNGVIGAVLFIGIIFAFRQVIRLFPEVEWVNGFRLAEPGLAVERAPVLLAPMATLLAGRKGRMAISQQMMRGILDSIGNRLDEARDISRYMTGLLVFLGLLGTFWGLIETVTSVGKVIDSLKVGADAGVVFDSLKEGLARPLGGMGISFSSSLFGLAGSLILGFLDLQAGQAQNRFYIDLEDWLSTTVHDLSLGEAGTGAIDRALERLADAVNEGGGGRQANAAVAHLAESIQSLVVHMRTEQHVLRSWAEDQGRQTGELRRLIETLAPPPATEAPKAEE